MLDKIEILAARRIAEVAAAARATRDRALSPVAAAKLGVPPPMRGVHNPAGELGFEAVPDASAAQRSLREAIDLLPAEIRRKLWVVMHVGRGDYAKRNWDAGLRAVDRQPDQTVSRDLAEEIDLHDQLMKGLYELGAIGPTE